MREGVNEEGIVHSKTSKVVGKHIKSSVFGGTLLGVLKWYRAESFEKGSFAVFFEVYGGFIVYMYIHKSHRGNGEKGILSSMCSTLEREYVCKL